ncbi:MAG: DUF2292 domain-containing protein [Verrucomicrobia bacterium]|nr:MAG: DUF2292 domain-containing protein [Verrucomicrobiota bacterium]
MTQNQNNTTKMLHDEQQAWIETVRRKVQAVRFGSIQITIHDGRVTQIESTEKMRIADVSSQPHEKVSP